MAGALPAGAPASAVTGAAGFFGIVVIVTASGKLSEDATVYGSSDGRHAGLRAGYNPR